MKVWGVGKAGLEGVSEVVVGVVGEGMGGGCYVC